MMLIPCPWRGPRNETEFHYGGQAGVAHPPDPGSTSDGERARFLFFRDSPRAGLVERWSHAPGCRRWFPVRRDTTTNAISPVDSARA